MLITELEKLSAAYTSTSLEDNKFYRLANHWKYCGWVDKSHCLIDPKGNHIQLQKDQIAVLKLCNSRINFNLPVLSKKLKDTALAMDFAGMIEVCEYNVADAPRYTLFDNHEANELSWAVTGRCNLKCKHCFLSAPNAKFGELPTEVCLKIIDDFASCGISRVSLTGGEPLVRSDLFQLIDYMITRGITVSGISTNGLLVTDRLLDELEGRGLHPKFSMSYDGTNGWHDWLRGIPGSEKKLLSAFEKLAKRGFYAGSAMTIHRQNIQEIFPSILQLREVGCQGFKANKVIDVGEWSHFNVDFGLSYRELFEAYMEVIPRIYETFNDGMPMRIVLSRFFSVEKNSKNYKLMSIVHPCTKFDRIRACESTYRRFHVSGDGSIQPCIALSSIDEQHGRLPNITEIGLKAAMKDPTFVKLAGATIQDVIDHNPECKDCPHISRCVGGCRAMGCAESQSNYYARCLSSCLFFKENYSQKVFDLMRRVCPEASCVNFTCESE